MPDHIDVTDKDSKERYEKIIGGMKGGGEVEVTLPFMPVSEPDMLQDIVDRISSVLGSDYPGLEITINQPVREVEPENGYRVFEKLGPWRIEIKQGQG